jgi:hypothetical protein
MTRKIRLDQATNIGSATFPPGTTLVLADVVADDLVGRGFGHRVVTEGRATIPNGQSSVSVGHELMQVPPAILVTGTHLEVVNCAVSSVDTVQFTIQAPGNVTAKRGVYWQIVPAN